MIDRQKLVGWTLIAVSVALSGLFLARRGCSSPGRRSPARNGSRVVGSIVVLMIGTANRLALARDARSASQFSARDHRLNAQRQLRDYESAA